MDHSILIGKKVLVTGARGFIGTTVCRQLAAIGASLYGVGRTKSGTSHADMNYLALDLTNEVETTQAFSTIKPDYVVHLAGCSVARREPEWVQRTFNANFVTTINVLLAAQKVEVTKLVIAGSLEQPDDSGAEITPSSPYAASKWAAAVYGKMFHSLYGMPVATARIFMVYGPGQAELQKMVPYVCLSTIAGRRPELTSGTRTVDWVYIDDVADGLISMLHRGPIDGSLIDIGTGTLTTTGDIAMMICKASRTGIVPILGAVPDRLLEQERVADWKRTERLLDWSARVRVEKGLQLTLEWYQKQCAEGVIVP